MGLVYLPTFFVDFYGKFVGKYTFRLPWDSKGVILPHVMDFQQKTGKNPEKNKGFFVCAVCLFFVKNHVFLKETFDKIRGCSGKKTCRGVPLKKMTHICLCETWTFGLPSVRGNRMNGRQNEINQRNIPQN